MKTKNLNSTQYDRRLCVRVDGIPMVENETFDQVLDKVMSLMTHRIGKGYVDKNSKKICESIIVRFSTSRYRTKFYRSRSKLKNNVKVNPLNASVFSHIETSQLICFSNQLIGFYMRATLAFNGLKLNLV